MERGGDINDNSFYAHFTPWHTIQINTTYNIRQPLHSPTLTWGYYIDNLAAKRLLKLLPKVFAVSDSWGYFSRFVKLRMLNRAIVFNNDDVFDSLIGERNSFNSGSETYSLFKTIIRKTRKIVIFILKIFH